MVAVLSGNRNFEGRIHAQVKASYLASPPLCVAYALAGTVNCDLTADPLGNDSRWQAGLSLRISGRRPHEVESLVASSVSSDEFDSRIRSHLRRRCEVEEHAGADRHLVRLGHHVDVRSRAALLRRTLQRHTGAAADITGARVLALLGDSITTDHISPAGSITVDSPAGQYLLEHSVSRGGVQ